MTDRPINFSAPMVRALHVGRKTQTRRVLKPQPLDNDFLPPDIVTPTTENRAGEEVPGKPFFGISPRDGYWTQRLPYAPGDRLWVREAWTARMTHGWTIADARSRMFQQEIIYRADVEQSIDGWWPSIHMPREFSRLTLLVTDVRVERLQDISEADVLAEGAPLDPYHRDGTIDGSNPAMCLGPTPHHRQSPRAWFHRLWNSLHGPDAWQANPWVCALTFDVVRANIDEVRV